MNEDLKLVLETIPEGILLYNQEEDKITLANSELKKLYNKTADQDLASDLHIKNLVPYDVNNKDQENKQRQTIDSQQALELIEAASPSEESSQYNYYQFLPKESNDRTNKPLQNFQQVVALKQCQIHFNDTIQKLILLKDLTNVVKCEQLQIENYFYEMLTAAVSHDMRTPLNSILGLLSNFDQFVISETGQKYLQVIKASSKFLLFLVNDLLDFFQIKNGKFKKNERNVDFDKEVKELLQIFRVAANEKGIDIHYNCHPNFPENLVLDDQRVKQILLNLLSNALKFTTNGSISVVMSYKYTKQQLKVSVKDTGIGIQNQDKEKLFKIFGKLDQTNSINTSGVGLGLNICKQIVEAMDGTIYLEDSSGSGSTFTFLIKCYQQNEEESADFLISQQSIVQNSNNSNNANQDYKISIQDDYNISITESTNHIKIMSFQPSTDLEVFKNTQRIMFDKDQGSQEFMIEDLNEIMVTDDNVFNIFTLQAILEMSLHLKSDKALNGQQAFKMYEERISIIKNPSTSNVLSKPYKLIFMDINMPVMDGFEATRQIRQLEEKCQLSDRVHIVALTAYTSESVAKRCIEAGMNDIILKPINTDQLVNIVKSVINLSS